MASQPRLQGLCRRVISCLPGLLLVLATAPVEGQYSPAAPVEQPMLDPRAVPPTLGMLTDQMVVDVRVEGNQSVSLEKIMTRVHTRAGRPYDPQIVEKDVKELHKTTLFASIRPMTKPAPGGLVVIFRVVERPTIQELHFVGNENINAKTLKKEIGFKVGDAIDPIAVESGKAKIEEYYKSEGYGKVRVTVYEGNKSGDRRVIYVINEGPKQKIFWVTFIGNQIVSGARLQTVIKSRHPYVWIFKGEVDRKQIDEDKERLTAYYRAMGFFKARVGGELEFNDAQNWATLTFVIDEGPRYKIRNTSFLGNAKFTSEELLEKTKLRSGEYFDQEKMKADLQNVQDKYGAVGYVFAKIDADNRFLEEPGMLDVVYTVTEGDRWKVGRLNIDIKGDNPHTQIKTVLDRLSLKPGDIVDTRKLRDSERRLKASGLFLNDPGKGQVPKIVFTPPNEDKDTLVADRPTRRTSYYPPYQVGPSQLPPLPPGERYLDFDLQHGNWGEGAPPPDGPVQPMEKPGVVRGQYTPEGNWAPAPPPPVYAAPAAPASGYAVPVPTGYAAPPGPVTSMPADFATPVPATATPPYGPTAAYAPNGIPANAYPQQNVYAQPNAQQNPYAQAAAPQPQYTQAAPQQFGQTPVAVAPNPAYGQQVGVPREPVLPPGAPMGAGLVADPSSAMVPGITGEPLRDLRELPLTLTQEETQTGRLMFGVGVNSDAGLVGNITLDEQNFDWTRVPTSWEDIRSGNAWRGAGQRFRIEAVPGTVVQRYMLNFQEPYLFDAGSNPVGLALSGYYYQRIYNEWKETREGGRVGLSYQFTHDLQGSVAFQGQNVRINDPEYPVPDLLAVLGNNGEYGFSGQLSHDTRDNQFLATEGHLLQGSFEEVIGSYNFHRATLEWSQYFMIYERADHSGRHVLSLSAKAGYSSDNTPIFERYYAGGFSSIRGFAFRGVTPRDPTFNMGIGGDFQLTASAQYLFPITADDMLRGVVFVDGGTIEPTISNWDQRFRVAPGFGLRITIPMMGPAPIALDFAFPVVKDPNDVTQIFSFFVGFNR